VLVGTAGTARAIGTVTLPASIVLPASKTTTLAVPVAVTWPEAGLLAQLAATPGGIPYAVDGTLTLGGPLLHVGVPFHFEGRISQAEILEAAARSLPRAP
jgi:hypothetical protein